MIKYFEENRSLLNDSVNREKKIIKISCYIGMYIFYD